MIDVNLGPNLVLLFEAYLAVQLTLESRLYKSVFFVQTERA